MFRQFYTAAVGLLLTALPAMAQSVTYTAPAPKQPNTEAAMAMQWIIGAGFAILIMVIAFKPAKRSNLQ